MPERARVEAFIAAVVSGDHVGAIRDFYTEGASMQENLGEPRRGREALMAHEAKALARLERMHTHPPRALVVDGDRVVVHWVFDAIGKDGSARRLEELAIQRWEGDRIAEERFFYDTATSWREVEAPADGKSAS
ncbi:MAG TPA: nuclear transport factor 2 family protein [Bosea sp. (in: a-proteobacteria)]|jgi:ketosteroid isomerase-like protein|uniref:nuclear transport factor 2 family protein n=1 Tax=Bosea sp. (in: a-proteobacteria) TaxID=1871050 RepID=UPI002E114459|nr:nuclear transport factor 2 family protein [Bosea sp. (in: a-proteobacteria)]